MLLSNIQLAKVALVKILYFGRRSSLEVHRRPLHSSRGFSSSPCVQARFEHGDLGRLTSQMI
jgi:hypothetical protein